MAAPFAGLIETGGAVAVGGAVAEQGLLARLAQLSGMLRQAVTGKGNFGMGAATEQEAIAMGRAWVGEGFRIARDGKTLVSSDGLRVFRPPSLKPNWQGGTWQANFEQRVADQLTGLPVSNAHLDIIK